MPSPKSELLRQEIRQLIENLLNYDNQNDPQRRSQLKIITNWNQNRFKVRAKLKSLLKAKVYKPKVITPTSLGSKSQQQHIDRLRYLLNKILAEKLQLLEDNRPDSGRGISEWNFTLKLKYAPEEMGYIQRNLIFFDQHWHQVYKTKLTERPLVNNLTVRQHSKFFGYEKELDRLLELLLPKSRMQTICIEGMSGSGKTTLAQEVAHYCLEVSQDKTHPLYFDALIFISAQNTHVVGNRIMPKLLAAEQRLEDIVRAVAENLEFPLEPALDFSRQLELLIRHLSHKLVLLVIDNLETIEDRDAVANLISHFPETVKVIVTTRIPFAQPNSCSITLTHLQPQPGAELIEDLAKKFHRILSPKMIDSIYKRTGGLPLAINYSVAQIITNQISDEQVPQLIDKTPQELLKFCFADLVKSLATTSAYQYLLIAALFPQFASLQAIAFINQTSEAIASDRLQHLKDLHLLFNQKTEQYSLHYLTQEYLQLELERQPANEAKLRDRQVQWYLQLVEPYRALAADEWHDYQELETEWINLRSVVEWCIWCDRYLDVQNFWQGLKGFTTILGYWRERQAWLEWLSDKAESKQDWQIVAEAKFHQSQSLARMDQTDASGEVMKLAREAWELREYCPGEWQFDLSLHITVFYIDQQNPDAWKTAQQWCDDSQKLLDRFQETINTYLKKQSQLLRYQGIIYQKEHQLERALDSFQVALQIAENINDQRGIAYIRAQLSLILIQQNKLAEAQQELLSHLELTKKYQDRRSESFCYQHLATVAKKLGNTEESKKYATLAHKQFTKLGMNLEAKVMEKMIAKHNRKNY